MADPLATLDDVEELWRPLSDEEAVRAARLLVVVSAQVRARVGDLDVRIADGTLDPELAAATVVAVVARALQNPDGIRQESIGDYSVTYASGGLLLSDADLADLLSPAPAVAMIRLGRWS